MQMAASRLTHRFRKNDNANQLTFFHICKPMPRLHLLAILKKIV
jgi:hypothetical protein